MRIRHLFHLYFAVTLLETERLVYLVAQRKLIVHEAVEVLHDNRHDVVVLKLSASGDVGRDQQVIEVPQFAVFRQRLDGEDVAGGAGDGAVACSALISASSLMMPPRDMPTSMAVGFILAISASPIMSTVSGV